MQHFKEKYLITNRILGSGAYGRVHMAVDQRAGSQLACKIIDLGDLKGKLREIEILKTRHTENRYPAAAAVDGQAQLTKVRVCAERKRQARNIERKLRTYDREVEILQQLRHVRQPICCPFVNLLRNPTAKHHLPGKGFQDREYNVFTTPSELLKVAIPNA